MRKTSILMTVILLSIVFSCIKTEKINAQNTNDLKLIKIIIDSVTFSEYSYNEANLISEERSKLRYTKYNYNDKNQLVSVDCYEDPAIYSSSSSVIEASKKRKEWTNPDNTKISYTTTFEYNNHGQVIKSTNNLGYNKYDYNDNNMISKLTYYHDDKISNYIDYEYDKRGNLIKQYNYQVSQNGDKKLINKKVFIYDNKKNPFRQLYFLMIPENTNSNNIVKTISENYYFIEGMKNDTSTIESFFEYNKSGYPVRKNKNIEYIYK
ncbi:MAG: hypothetical protein NTW49_11755 [Bacteroidia bacterium]|nr:hypothetical protein [Bacteroidia bacterium]